MARLGCVTRSAAAAAATAVTTAAASWQKNAHLFVVSGFLSSYRAVAPSVKSMFQAHEFYTDLDRPIHQQQQHLSQTPSVQSIHDSHQRRWRTPATPRCCGAGSRPQQILLIPC